MFRLYVVTCRATKKLYAGYTQRTLDVRWKAHVYTAFHPQTNAPYAKLHKAIVKYGPDEFFIEEMHSYPTIESVKEAEVALIAAMDLMNAGYNSSPGGDAGPAKGQKRSPETIAKFQAAARRRADDPEWIEKMKAVARERWSAPEYRLKISKALTGRKATEETRASIRTARARQVCTPQTRAKMSAASVGRKHTSESLARMSVAQKGRQISPECRKKISDTLSGRKQPPRSPEHCQKIREHKLAYWQRRREDEALAIYS